MKRKVWLLLSIVISGTLLFGGIYYLKYVVFGPIDTYEASSMFFVGYAYLPFESRNFYSSQGWSDWLHSEEVLTKLVKGIGADDGGSDGVGGDGRQQLTNNLLSSYLTIQCPENYEMITINVTTPDPQLSIGIAEVVNEFFPLLVKENQAIGVAEVRLVDYPLTAHKVMIDVRPLRAFILGAVIFLLFTSIGYFLYASGDIKIRIPDTFVRRFGIPAFCYRTYEEFRELVDYLFADGNLCVVKVGMSIPDQQVLHCLQPYISELRTADDLRLRNSTTVERSGTQPECVTGYVRSDDTQTECMTEYVSFDDNQTEYVTEYVSSDDTGDHICGEILLVLVAARNRDGEIENALQLLRQKGYHIKVALLWQPNLRLLTDYYTLPYVSPGN
jgi:hypothetical protein